MPSCRAKLDTIFPSTSRGHNPTRHDLSSSPVSPTGRIAKRNAQLITEMGLKNVKRASAFSETIMGTVPDFETCDLSEKCSIIQKILDSDDNLICIEHLNLLQKQIENLIVHNVDNQKRIYGEILYLNTGDYPTCNLKDRLMPTYILRSASPIDKMRSKVFVENAIDLGLNSSPEEDEENPSVVDVPQRFWNWSREYLRHITEDYVKNFKKKIVDSFNDDIVQKYLCCDFTVQHDVCNTSLDKCSNDKSFYTNGNGINYNNNDGFTMSTLKFDKKLKRRFSRSVDDCPLPIKNRNSDSLLVHAIACTLSEKNDNDELGLKKTKLLKDYNNGFEMEDKNKSEERELEGQKTINDFYKTSLHYLHKNDFSSALLNKIQYGDSVPSFINTPKNGLKLGNVVNSKAPLSILSNLRELGFALSSYGVDKGIISTDFSLKDIVFFENAQCAANLKTDVHDENDSNLDEVTREIKKKQKELFLLYNVTRPAINEIFERIQSEYALYETSRRLDLIDDRLFGLGSKYDHVIDFTKDQRQECAQALSSRNKALKQFNYHFFK